MASNPSFYDVMPVDEEGWKVPPFSAEVLEGTEIDLPEDYGKVLVGRGTRNQKGPVVAFMNALKSTLMLHNFYLTAMADNLDTVAFIVPILEAGHSLLDTRCMQYPETSIEDRHTDEGFRRDNIV